MSGRSTDDLVAELARERASAARLGLLTRASLAFARAVTPMEVADVAVEHFGLLMGTDSVAVYELRGAESLDAVTLGGWVQGAREGWTTMPLDAPAPVADAARGRIAVWSEADSAWRDRYPHLVDMLGEYGYQGVVGLPLLIGDDVVGAIGIGFVHDVTLDEPVRRDAMTLADQCALSLRRSRSLQVESDARRSAEQLTSMVSALSRARTPDQVRRAIAEAAAAFGARTTYVATCTGPKLHIVFAQVDATPGGTTSGEDPPAELPLSAAHPLAYTARTGEAVWLAKRSQLAWQERSFTAAEQVPAVDISVPLVLDDTVTGALGMSFDHGAPDLSPQQRSTILALAGQSAQALERARLHQAEHDIAETLQRSLLPAGIPCLERIEFAAHYLPAADVAQAGGDWYDVLDIGQHTVAIAVGDVVGHGPAAAALMGQLRTALALCLLRGDSPSRALHQLDRFAARIPGARGSSAICLLLDCLSGDVLWASAGHPPALLVTLDGTRFLEDAVPGPVLGLPPTVRAAPYRDHSVTIAPGSTVILYTDGLVERPASPVGHDLRRLAETAGRLAAHGPARAASAILREFADDPSAPDDIALITARFMPAPMRRRRPADPAELAGVRTEVGVWAGQCGLPEDMCQDLQFALGEALANSMEHAYRDTEPGSVEFELARTADGSVAVTVTDLGRWRPPPDDPGHRGRGLSMIGVLADDVDVRHDTAGTTVRFRLPPAPTGEDLPPGQPPAPMPRSDRPTPAAATADQVVLPGHVDLTNVHTLRAELLDAVRPGDDPTPLTLDLRSTTYLASAGVALIIDVVERGETLGRTVAIRVRPGSAVARTLTLSGLDHVTGSGEGGRNPDRITTIQDAAAP